MQQLNVRELTLDSREVANMVNKNHGHLLRDIRNYVSYISTNPELDSLDFFRKSAYKDDKGEIRSCYLITKKGCEFIAHKMTGRKGTQFTATYINKFHEMQNQLINQKDSYMIDDPIQRAKKWIEEQEEKQALIKQVEENKPKVLFADAVSASDDSILVRELATILKQNGIDTGQNRLFTWLRDNGYLIKRKGTDYNMPTQKSMDLGLFEIKETSIVHSDDSVSISKTPKVTGKGQLYFIKKFKAMELTEAS
ncbi:MAG: phage regulatory protein/antirepressor Ant [Halanaerobiales bacterium]